MDPVPRTAHTTTRTWLIIAVSTLALLAGVLAMADQGQAAIDDVQSYTWSAPGDPETLADTTDGDGDRIDPVAAWTQIPDGTDENERESNLIPGRGLVLVSVEYSSVSTDTIRFDWIEEQTLDEDDEVRVDAQDGDTDFVYRINFDQDEDAQRVHRAFNITYYEDDPTTPLNTGEDGCGNDQGEPGFVDENDLHAGTNGQLCFFLIELTEPGHYHFSGTSPFDQGSADLNEPYVLEARVGSDRFREGGLEAHTVFPVELDLDPSDFEVRFNDFVTGADETTIEQGTSVTLNLTLRTGVETSHDRVDGSDDTDDGDVDVWLCLYRPSNVEEPYQHFNAFTGSLPTTDLWEGDNPVDCEYINFPTGNESARDPTNGLAIHPVRQDPVESGGFGDGTETRFYEYTFTLAEDLEPEGTSFVDEFFFRVITRDVYGNVVVEDRDSTGGSPTDVQRFKVATYDLEMDPVTVPDFELTTFRDNDGCFQDAGDNSASNPCNRTLDLTPDPDFPAIEIPIEILNHGNAEDQVRVRATHEGGEQAWEVTLRGPSGATSNENGILTFEISEHVARNDPARETVTVEIQPDDQALGGEFKVVELEISSLRADSASIFQRLFLEGELFEIHQASLLLEGERIADESASPDDIFTIPASIENTGNTQARYWFDLASNSDNVCRIGTGSQEDRVNIQFQRTSGSTITASNALTVSAGSGPTDIQLRVDVGRDVPRTQGTPFRCSFTVINEEGANPELVPKEPALDLTITGASNIQIIELTELRQDEVNVTGTRLAETVAPTSTGHTVELFLENVGTVSLDPKLTIRTLQDDKNLAGSWVGVDATTGNVIPFTTARQAFTLTHSDAEDVARIKDHLSKFGQGGGSGITEQGSWECLSVDADSPQDGEDRVVCRVLLQFRPPTDNNGNSLAVRGDHAVYEIEWVDETEGIRGNVTVDLTFDHVGQVTVDSITRHVVDTGSSDSSTVTFDAVLNSGRDFGAAGDVASQLSVEFGTESCETGGPESFRSTQTTAGFQVPVNFDTGGFDCTWSGNQLVVTVPSGEEGTAQVSLVVEDDEGSILRVREPAHLRLVDDADDAPTTSMTDFLIQPDPEMPVNGTQYARLVFSPPSTDNLDSMVLTRRTGESAFEPYTDCTFDGHGESTESKITVVSPSTGLSDDVLNDEDRLDADQDFAGLILQEGPSSGDQDRAVVVGSVTIVGWGDGSTLEWREGWNPLVLYIEDRDGDPARNLAGVDEDDLDVDLNFVLRANSTTGPITDSFKLSTDDDSLPLRSLAGGYYALDVFLPEGLDDADLDALAGTRAGASSFTLADHPVDDRFDLDVEAWSLHVGTDRLRSTGGDDLDGDAYWSAADLGLVEPGGPATDEPEFNGTAGTSAIQDSGQAAGKSEIDFDPSDDPREDDRTFVHASVRFLGGPMDPAAPLHTGFGVHDYATYLLEEEDQPQTGGDSIGERDQDTANEFHEHTFQPYTDGTASLFVQARDRSSLGNDRIVSLTPDADTEGLFKAVTSFPDTGSDVFTWRTQVTVRDGDGDRITRLLADVTTHAQREPSSNGIPMPLCIENDSTGNAPGLFGKDDLGSNDIVDLRAIPGLRLDRGQFTLNPVLSDGNAFLIGDPQTGGPYENTLATIQGAGLIGLDISRLPDGAEVGVPITIQVGASGPVDNVRAELRAGGEAVETVTLSLKSGLYTGSIEPDSEGAHTLRILATDTAGGVTVADKVLNISENAPPRISITRPSLSDTDTGAIRPGGSMEASVTDRSITASAISVELKDTGSGDDDGPTPGPLTAENVSITGVQNITTPGDKSLSVSITNETGESVPAKVYVNLTGADESSFMAEGADGSVTGTLQFNVTGDYTLTVETNRTDVTAATFDVLVEEESTAGTFQPVPASQVSIDCSGQSSCDVTYTPTGLSDGDTLEIRIIAEVAADDTSSRTFTVTVDDTPPSVSITINQPKVGQGSQTIVGPATSVDVTATPSTDVDTITVRGLRDDTERGSTTVSQATATVSLSDIGLDTEGSATIEVSARDEAGNAANETTSVTVDATPPELDRANVEPSGGNVRVSVEATDTNGIGTVTLFHRAPGAASFSSKTMEAGDGDVFSADVDVASDATELEYYIEATDAVNNKRNLGDRGTPRLADLSGFDLTNEAPTVSIISPTADARLRGIITVEFDVEDPDLGDTLSITTRVNPTSGSPLSVDVPTGETTLEVDVSELEEGGAMIVVEVSDGEETASDSVNVMIDNNPDPREPTMEPGEDLELCFNYEAPANTTRVEFQLMRNNDAVATSDATESEPGVWCANFDVTEEGTYVVNIKAVDADGETTDERTSDVVSIQSIGDALGAPVGRFVTVLVLAMATAGLAAFAAFGRWGQ